MQTRLDFWIKSKSQKPISKRRKRISSSSAIYIKLKPVGYPLRCDCHERHRISTDDIKLFEMYAKEQWLGYSVKKGEFLFDQRMYPDFAFEVVETIPKKHCRITEETVIELEANEVPVYREIFEETRFRDIIGQERAKKKCEILEKYLEDPDLFGEWAPKNILFYGPPGTGKTMTAKALAFETKVPLFLIKATDLIGEHVGDGASRIHEMYKNVSRRAPSIIFIDELDAIGLDRRYQSLRGDVLEIVNALLAEMDGIPSNKGVITIAATNNIASLDPAIRSRFEEEIEFSLPNESERRELLNYYAKRIPIGISVKLEPYVSKTRGMSGRDIKEKFLKTALHKAILDGDKQIESKHLEYALKVFNTTKSEPPRDMFV